MPTFTTVLMKVIHPKSRAAKLASENLKRCPLCGGINALSNFECFVCTWSGTFDHEPSSVQEGLEDLMSRCPELAELMLEQSRKKRGLFAQFWKGLKSLFQREPLDIWA